MLVVTSARTQIGLIQNDDAWWFVQKMRTSKWANETC